MVSQIRFKNFKIFRQWQTLELRPITILIGKNNSGKSAVAKLPTMIAPPLRGEPLNWINKIGDDFVELGSDFSDLVYGRNAGIGQLELAISNHNNSSKIELVYNKEYGILEYKKNNELQEVTNNIKGFLIEGKTIPDLYLNIDYIGAIRAKPNSNYTFSNIAPKNIGIEGQNAYSILIEDYKKKDIVIIPKVSNWYKENFENWGIEVIESKMSTEVKYEIAIVNNDLKVNIQQTGQGIHQVLPLIIRSFMPEKEPTLIIIEEPETHLHPAAHGVLAQRFVESYLEDGNKRYLIETHSQNFVLRMRRLVAEGTLKAEDLAIYYVGFDEEKKESSLKKIGVDSLGRVAWWPEHIFNETLTETMAIRNAQLDKQKVW